MRKYRKKLRRDKKLLFNIAFMRQHWLLMIYFFSLQINHHVYKFVICKAFLSISNLLTCFFIKSNLLKLFIFKDQDSCHALTLVENGNIIRMGKNMFGHQNDDILIKVIQALAEFLVLSEQKKTLITQWLFSI